MPRPGARKLYKYTDDFKQTAVRLRHQPGMQVKPVAYALEIHPFMLSKWRKDVRDGNIRGRAVKAPPPGPAREIAQLQALEQPYAERQQERTLLRKAIRFCSARKGESFVFIDAHCTQFDVTWLCHRFTVTPSGFYAWRARGVGDHARQDRRLTTGWFNCARAITSGTAARASTRRW